MTTSRVTTKNETVKRPVKTVSVPVASASSVPSLGIKLKSGININDPALLVSPLATLAAFRAGNPFLGLQDRAHAYNTLHTRLRMFISECAMQKVPLASFSSLDSVKPIIGHTSIITEALVGDLHFATLDPWKHTNIHSTEDHSLDVLYDVVPSSEAGSDVSEDEESLLVRANQAPVTALAALTVLGDIFTTPVCSLFSHENLISLLTVLTALFSPSGENLPIAQTSRIRATAMWILARCKLPPEICRSCVGNVVVSIRCALIMGNVDGLYRARHKDLWLDAWKAAERFLRSHESGFLAPMASQILPSVLSHLTPRTSGTNSKMQDDPEIRFGALGFMQSFSLTLFNLSETHSDRDQVSLEAAKKMAAKSIHDYFISSSSLTEKYLTEVDSKSPLPSLQVLITLSCLIISSSRHIFAHSSLEFILPLMSQLGNHERSTVRVFARWVWRCLCFCATQVTTLEKRKKAVEVCCGILDEGIGGSLVAALQSRDMWIVLERMLHSPLPNKPPTMQTRTEGMMLLDRLTSVPANSTSTMAKRDWTRERLLSPLLFSSKLLSLSLSESGAKNLISEAREKGKIEFANFSDVEPVPIGETKEATDIFIQDVVGILAFAVSVPFAKEEKGWCAVVERHVPKIWNDLLERYRLVHRKLSKSPERHSNVQHSVDNLQHLASTFRHLLHTILTAKPISVPLHLRFKITRLLTGSTALFASTLRQEVDWTWVPEVIHYLLYLLSECPLHRYEDPSMMKEWICLMLCLKSECAKWCHPREVDEEQEITMPHVEESGSQSDVEMVESSSVDLLSQVATIEEKIHGVISGSVHAYDWERLLRSFLLEVAESEMDVAEWIGYVFQRVFEAINDEDIPRTSEYFDLVKCTQRLALAFSYTPRFALLEMLAYALQYAYEIDDGRHSDFETRIALWDIASDMLGSVDVAEEGQQLVDVLIVLQEPVAVWLRDEYWRFKDAEYAQLLPFYNRALALLTLLPSDGTTDAPNGVTVDILNDLAPLLTSVFLHETTPVKAAGPIAFMDFWADHCGHIYEGDFENLERGLKKALGALGKWGLEVPEAWVGWGDGDEDSWGDDMSVVPGTLSDEEDQ